MKYILILTRVNHFKNIEELFKLYFQFLLIIFLLNVEREIYKVSGVHLKKIETNLLNRDNWEKTLTYTKKWRIKRRFFIWNGISLICKQVNRETYIYSIIDMKSLVWWPRMGAPNEYKKFQKFKEIIIF